MGSIGVTIKDYVSPAKIYLNNVLVKTVTNEQSEHIIDGLIGGKHQIRITDEMNVTELTVVVGYIPCYEYNSYFTGGMLEEVYQPTYIYGNIQLPPNESDYVDEEINV